MTNYEIRIERKGFDEVYGPCIVAKNPTTGDEHTVLAIDDISCLYLGILPDELLERISTFIRGMIDQRNPQPFNPKPPNTTCTYCHKVIGDHEPWVAFNQAGAFFFHTKCHDLYVQEKKVERCSCGAKLTEQCRYPHRRRSDE